MTLFDDCIIKMELRSYKEYAKFIQYLISINCLFPLHQIQQPKNTILNMN